MSEAVPGAVPALRPVDDPVAVHERATSRYLEQEGIPVVLALLDRREDAVGVRTQDAGAPPDGEGPELVRLFDVYAAAIAPGAPDDDAAALYAVADLVGYAHVHPGAPPREASR